MPRKKGGPGDMDIPLIGDISKKLSKDYDVKLKNGVALRGTFMIDEKGILRHKSINNLSEGRNVDEVLHLVEAFKFTDLHGKVCPSYWKNKRDSTMVPEIMCKKTEEYFQDVYSKK